MSDGKHAMPDIDSLDAKIQQMAEDYMARNYEAGYPVTALDGYIAGWRAAERHFDGGAQ